MIFATSPLGDASDLGGAVVVGEGSPIFFGAFLAVFDASTTTACLDKNVPLRW